MRPGARLESSAPQHISPALPDKKCRLDNLFQAFHRTGTTDYDRTRSPAHLNAGNSNNSIFGVEIPRDQLVRFRNVNDPLHAPQFQYFAVIHIPVVTQHANGRSLAPRYRFRSETHFLNDPAYSVNIGLGGIVVHNNQHDNSSLS
jgi:hypothetical protein